MSEEVLATIPISYSEKEAAAYPGISLSTIRRWRRKNVGPDYFRFGDVLRYSGPALDQFREKNTVRASRAA